MTDLPIARNTALLSAALAANSGMLQLQAAVASITLVQVLGIDGLLGLGPAVVLACGALAIALTRYVSLGSIVGAAVAGMIVLWQGFTSETPGPFLVYGTAVPAFVFWAHRGNIQRLLSGTERKLSRGSVAR